MRPVPTVRMVAPKRPRHNCQARDEDANIPAPVGDASAKANVRRSERTTTAAAFSSGSSTGLSPPAIAVNGPTRLPLGGFTFS